MIYVDDMRLQATVGKLSAVWSHMWSDTSIAELDDFAAKLHLRPSWLQNSQGFVHYDVVESVRQRAIKLGATEISYSDLPEHSAKVKAYVTL